MLMPTTRLSTITTTFLVLDEDGLVGEIILDDRDRVVHAGSDIPKDVVLKALVAFTRCNEEAGWVRSRQDHRLYSWQVMGLD